jgi:hypothetical protein
MFSLALRDFELIEPSSKRKYRIEHAILAVPRGCKCPAKEERIHLDWKRFIIVQMVLAVLMPIRTASNPLVTLEAKLCIAVF